MNRPERWTRSKALRKRTEKHKREMRRRPTENGEKEKKLTRKEKKNN